MNMLNEIFLWIVESSVGASAVALFVLLIKKLFTHRLSPRIHYALWLIVVIRLLVPAFPSSSISIFTALEVSSNYVLKGLGFISNHQDRIFGQAVESYPQGEHQVNRELLRNDQPGFAQPEATTTATQGAEGHQLQNDESTESSNRMYTLWITILSIVWLVGFTVMLYLLYGYKHNMKQKNRFLTKVTDSKLLSIMDQCQKKFGIDKSIPIYTGDTVKSPYIVGQLRPWVYCPREVCRGMSDSELTHILSHELAHYKRKDILWNTLGMLALAIHWMNPLVWICMNKMRADMELACDAYVLEVIGEEETEAYGMTIISFLKRFSVNRERPHLLYFSKSSKKGLIERRIRMISIFKKGSYKLSAVAIVCGVVISAVTLTNASGSVAEVRSADKRSNEHILFDPYFFDNETQQEARIDGFTHSNRLQKAEQRASFRFKVPEYIPENNKFYGISIRINPKELLSAQRGTETTHKDINKVCVRYNGSGILNLSANNAGLGIESAYAKIKEDYSRVEKEKLFVNGLEVTKVIVSPLYENYKKYYFIWLDNDNIQYQLELSEKNQEQVEKIITSMKYPDQALYDRYVNNDLIIPIYDKDDFIEAQKLLEFTPKLPMKLSNKWIAEEAYVTKKINFSFPENEAEREYRVLSMRFASTDKQKTDGISGFSFNQIRDRKMFMDMKKNGHAPFERIDGKKFVVKVTPVTIEGREILKTEPYKIDEEMSSTREPDITSYFWLENDICYKVSFTENGDSQQKVIASLIKEKMVDVNKLESMK
ncbi:M56 family metallopeptidase [Brevibacillus laterosporus]|uniref:M56 family metallopeptidase n=1 Tax=Brevibacillus laterosporus TaxID=1465 RepID=UPI000B9A75C6|nr:M56 family metallopeptidase [Brevibacillus laterosporus]